MNENTHLARRLLRQVDTGVLSTQSAEIEGYPFGSITPFVGSHEGRPVIFVSHIAQHTHNMNRDARSCLTVMDSAEQGTNQQALGRATIVGDAAQIPPDALASVEQRYFSAFPEAEQYRDAHNFAFYWIDPVRIRYIGGFGKIFWIEREDWCREVPAFATEEKRIVTHMNEDHEDALRAMCEQVTGTPVASARLLTVDDDGFQVRTDRGLQSIEFDSPCVTTDDVHTAMVQLARQAKAATQA